MSGFETISVYCMPGMAANPLIFERFQLPKPYKLYFLEWFPPTKNEPIAAYAKRMADKVIHKNPILLGVSFGGILVQEMAKHIKTRRIVIISSIKTHKELPLHMRLGRQTKVYKLLPTQWVNSMEAMIGFAFGPKAKKRMQLHQKYLSVRDKPYLDWAIEAMVEWQQISPPQHIIHLHGSHDLVLPPSGFNNYIPIEGATHALMLTHCGWLNKNLPKLLSDEN